MKGIISKDPRKKPIVKAFKQLANCTKVTIVQENESSYFADCHKRLEGNVRGFENLGTFEILKSDVKL
jgi:hypothetical protein